jgi:hypothetical protein
MQMMTLNPNRTFKPKRMTSQAQRATIPKATSMAPTLATMKAVALILTTKAKVHAFFIGHLLLFIPMCSPGEDWDDLEKKAAKGTLCLCFCLRSNGH